MFDFFRRLFSSDGFMPHGHCYLWRPEIVWLHVISDAIIALAYLSIPFTLVYFARRRKDLPFDWIFVCFAVFIVSCGATHWLEIWTLWTPAYRLSGMVKAVTAFASIVTAVLLVRIVPRALAIPSPETYRVALEKLAASEVALQHANRELEAFSYSVAHDLRAPLRGMQGFAEMIASENENKLDADSLKMLRLIQKNATGMNALVDALLALSRSTNAELHVGEVDVSALAARIASELAAAHPDRAVDFVIAPSLELSMDPELASVVFENLLGNAFKFTAHTEAARIEVGTAEGAVFVRDNGAGFDMAYQEKLFRPFGRLHAARDFEGTGIGLATVHRIVQRHGGKIWAKGAPDQGATFFVRVPKT